MAGRQQREHAFSDELAVGQSLRYRFSTNRGRVTVFTVQLEVYDVNASEWRPVVRYDNAHGAPHRDILDWSGRVVEKDWLPTGVENEQAMQNGVREIKAHRTVFVEAFWRTKP
jgi:hypothetical protein